MSKYLQQLFIRPQTPASKTRVDLLLTPLHAHLALLLLLVIILTSSGVALIA